MPPTKGSWDPATSVGTTATMVAAARAIATANGDINDPFAEPLVRAVGVTFLTRWATGELSASDVDVEGSPWGLAQMPASIAARTRYFDEFFADAAAAGIRQAVILASGLDTRAYRLGWPGGMTVEVDSAPRPSRIRPTWTPTRPANACRRRPPSGAGTALNPTSP